MWLLLDTQDLQGEFNQKRQIDKVTSFALQKGLKGQHWPEDIYLILLVTVMIGFVNDITSIV